jgi:hypothetical protein
MVVIMVTQSSFLSGATDVPTKITMTNLAKGQYGYFNLQAENTTDFNSISTDDMDCQSVNNENTNVGGSTQVSACVWRGTCGKAGKSPYDLSIRRAKPVKIKKRLNTCGKLISEVKALII